MDELQIEGNWKGEIQYSAKHGTPASASLFFALTIKGNAQEFHGIAQDLYGYGLNPDAAKLKGTMQGSHIYFTKQYPSYHYAYRGRHRIHKGMKGPIIRYTGIWNAETQIFEGKWHIRNWMYFLGIIPIPNRTEGIWTMYRIDTNQENPSNKHE